MLFPCDLIRGSDILVHFLSGHVEGGVRRKGGDREETGGTQGMWRRVGEGLEKPS